MVLVAKESWFSEGSIDSKVDNDVMFKVGEYNEMNIHTINEDKLIIQEIRLFYRCGSTL